MEEYNEQRAEEIIKEVESLLNKYGYECSVWDECAQCDIDDYDDCLLECTKVGLDKYVFVEFGRDLICATKVWDDAEKQFITPIEMVVDIFNAVLYEFSDKYNGSEWE